MGILSKKTLVCERCGRQYQARIALGAHICEDCAARERAKKEDVQGYVDYAKAMGWKAYSEQQLDEIISRRNAILEKYRVTDGISREELMVASENYKKLTDAEAENILDRIDASMITSSCGAASTVDFFALTAYDRVVVDADDVFAVAYTTDYRFQNEISEAEAILCVIFTNDPYIPVFPMLFVEKRGFFEVIKSKKGREAVQMLFMLKCQNLTYPVQDFKQLKKQVKTEGTVRGNMDEKFMFDKMEEAIFGMSVFNGLLGGIHSSTISLLDEYGYILDEDVDRILKMDKMFNRNYWIKQDARVSAMRETELMQQIWNEQQQR